MSFAGDPAALQIVNSQQVGDVGICPQQRVEAVIDPSVQGEQLAKDMIAYWIDPHNNLDNECGSLLLVDSNAADIGGPYTAGRVILDVSSGSHHVEIDLATTQQQFAIDYTQRGSH